MSFCHWVLSASVGLGREIVTKKKRSKERKSHVKRQCLKASQRLQNLNLVKSARADDARHQESADCTGHTGIKHRCNLNHWQEGSGCCVQMKAAGLCIHLVS